MSQTQQDPPQANPPASAATPPPPAGAVVDDDPLAHLHKMSTTAGLGSGDYVAVNAAAIFCVITGLASALSLLDNLLLVLPLAAVVAAGVALRQINQSNGTQTGKGLVVLGLLCAVLFGGFVVFRDATEGVRTRSDRQVIGAIVEGLGEKFKAGDFAGAYAMFSPRFQQRVSQEQFEKTMKPLRESPVVGALQRTTWNGLADFSTDETTGERYCVTNIQFEFQKNKPAPMTMTLHKVQGRWLIDDIPDFFPPEQRPRR